MNKLLSTLKTLLVGVANDLDVTVILVEMGFILLISTLDCQFCSVEKSSIDFPSKSTYHFKYFLYFCLYFFFIPGVNMSDVASSILEKRFAFRYILFSLSTLIDVVSTSCPSVDVSVILVLIKLKYTQTIKFFKL